MAKRKRRHYGDIVALPLGGFTDAFKASIKGTDVLIGAGAAIGGIAALNYVKNKFPRLTILQNPTVQRFAPVIAGVAAGAAGMLVSKKVLKKPSHANGVLAGAVAAGVFLTALNEVKTRYPAFFADTVDLRLAGLIVDDVYRGRGYNGLIVDDRAPVIGAVQRAPAALNGYADNPSLGDLAALAMTVDDDEVLGVG